MHNGITMHNVYVCFCTHRVVVESSVQEVKECERMLVSHFWIFMIRFGCSPAGQSFSMIRLEGAMVAHVFCPGMLCGFVSLWIPEFLQLLICRSTGVQQVFPSTSDGTKRQLLEVPLVFSFPNLRKQRYASKNVPRCEGLNLAKKKQMLHPSVCEVFDNLLEAQAIITDNAGSPKPPALKGSGWQRDRWSLLSFEAILKSRTKNETLFVIRSLFQIFEHLYFFSRAMFQCGIHGFPNVWHRWSLPSSHRHFRGWICEGSVRLGLDESTDRGMDGLMDWWIDGLMDGFYIQSLIRCEWPNPSISLETAGPLPTSALTPRQATKAASKLQVTAGRMAKCLEDSLSLKLASMVSDGVLNGLIPSGICWLKWLTDEIMETCNVFLLGREALGPFQSNLVVPSNDPSINNPLVHHQVWWIGKIGRARFH